MVRAETTKRVAIATGRRHVRVGIWHSLLFPAGFALKPAGDGGPWPPPNVDLALAALGLFADMPEDAGEAIFTPTRIVDWLAHAMEEYEERPLRFRPRAVYLGDV